jgi:hypothetical protein
MSVELLKQAMAERGKVRNRVRTTAPNDQISVAVFHGISKMISGLDHKGVPTMVPDVAHFESMG